MGTETHTLQRTIPINVSRDEVKPAAFYLVEEISTGTYGDDNFRIVRTINGLLVQIRFKKMTASINLGGEIQAVLDEMLQLDETS